LTKVCGHETDLPGLGQYGGSAFALQRLRIGMIHLEYRGVCESVQSPRARVEARAEDYELRDGRGGGNCTIQNHRPKLVEQAHTTQSERVRRPSRLAV
jgi:hypothetical protein